MSAIVSVLHKREGEREIEVMASEKEKLYNAIEIMMEDDDESKKKQFSNHPSICRVPESLRKVKESAYAPHVVSIGPLHRDVECLKGMQKHKVSYMHTLFRRTAKSPFETMRQCADAMLKAVPDARTCYAQTFEDSNVQLANTLLVDGCFILELFFRFENNNNINENTDPVFMNSLSLGSIRRDLLLLENQIPFSVLQQLFQLTLHKHSKSSLTQYVVRFFGRMMIFGSEMTERHNGTTETRYDHILGFLHNYYQPASNSKPGRYPVVRYSATQLHRTGVKFKASEGNDYIHVKIRTYCFMLSRLWRRWNTRRESTSEERRKSTQLPRVMVNENGKNHPICTPTPTSSSICCLFSPLRTLFSKTPNWRLFQLCISPCLELPRMRVSDSSELFLRNLIAYEQCSPAIDHYVTSYAFLMDTLINSEDDVEFLEDEKVLQNYLGASKHASDLFNNLCKEIFFTDQDFYFSYEWKQLNDYCNLYWPKELALLRRTYFTNPWTIISLIGALVLFGLAVFKTLYSIK